MKRLCSPQLSCLSLLLYVACLVAPNLTLGQCNPPSQLPTQMCQDAPLTCLLNACYLTQNWSPNDEPDSWCMGSYQIHNPQYFLFQAIDTTVQIHIHVNWCSDNSCGGLQSAIIDTCSETGLPWNLDDVLSCDGQECAGGTMVLSYDSMVVGEYYWLMIDGFSGDICEYTIVYVEGIYTPGISTELVNAETNDPVVCQGQDNWTAFADPFIPEAHWYQWNGFPWPPGYYITGYPNISIPIPDNAPPGIYDICVFAFSGCDSTDYPVCFQLEIVEIDDGYAEPETLCPEDYVVGIIWAGINITAPGIYLKTINTPEGCPYDTIKEFTVFPEPVEGVIDTVVCTEFFSYEGVAYYNPGFYELFYDSSSVNGCDSVATLNLELIYLEAEANLFCESGLVVLTSEIIYAVPGLFGIQYEWYHNGTLVSEDPSFATNASGIYELYVSLISCEFPALNNPFIVNLENLVPGAPDLDMYSNVACAFHAPIYSIIPDLSGEIQYYVWSVDPPGVPISPQGTLNSELEVNWLGFTGGTICVHAVNHCGPGPDTCFNVSVIPSPVADFMMPLEACVDSSVTIIFTGSGSPDATIIWNFGGGSIHEGGSGIGPHLISWGSPGFHTVSLQIIEEGCDTAEVAHEIFVETLGQPVVSCNSTLNSITFIWSPVFGAESYEVHVLLGPNGTLINDTTYIVNGLAAGTSVEIEVISTGFGACPSAVVIAECIAQSCPPKTIQILIPADTICLGEVSGIIPLSALVDGAPASGTWSGPGVDPSGTFDPNDASAGVGVHTIVFAYSEGTCIYQRSRDITMFESPTATFTVDAAICQVSSTSVQYTGNASLNAHFMWNFGTGMASGNGAGPYWVSWNTPGLYTIELIVEEQGCVSEMITHTVDVQPVMTAPIIQCFPTTSSVTIQWSNIPNATDYDVTHLFGPMGVLNGNQYVVNNINPGDSVSIEITVSGNTLCPPVIVEASCVAQPCPMPIISIDQVDDICLYPGTATVDLNVTVMNGNGTGVWSGPGVTDVIAGIFDPNLTGDGMHLIEYNYTENGCGFVESLVVNVFDPPMAVISNTSFTLTCDNNSELVLDGANSIGIGALSFLWATPNGLVIGPNDKSTVIAGAAGEYFLTVIDQLSQCQDIVSVALVIDDGVPMADAGSDVVITCDVEVVILGGNSSSGPSITYAWSTSEGTIDSDPTAATITVSENGTYALTVTDNDNECTAVDQVVVALDMAQPSGTVDVSNTLNCNSGSATVSANFNPLDSYLYQWKTIDGNIVSGEGTSEIIVDRVGIYTVYVTSDANGCTDTISTEVFADPEVITAIDAVVDSIDCVGDNDGMIEIIQVLGGTPPYSYAWSNQTSGSGVLFLSPNTYTVTITDANGCSITESYTLHPAVPMNPEIGPDLTYEYEETVTITLNVTNPGSIAQIIWEGVAPDCPGCFQNSFEAETSGNVFVTVIDEHGCEATDALKLTVTISRNVYIPTVFSPNGDNINDIFLIRGAILERIEYLRIFDRWGNVVYDQPPVVAGGAEGWDGTFKGKPLNPGVYVYTALLIHRDGFEEAVIGDVTLVR